MHSNSIYLTPFRDVSWDINDHLVNLKEKLKSWQNVFWRYGFYYVKEHIGTMQNLFLYGAGAKGDRAGAKGDRADTFSEQHGSGHKAFLAALSPFSTHVFRRRWRSFSLAKNLFSCSFVPSE